MSFLHFTKSIKAQDMSVLFMQMALLLDSGIGFLECMQSVQSPNKKLKAIIVDIQQRLQSGLSLGEAFKCHEDVFGNLSCAIITLGQTSGNLPAALFELSGYFQKRSNTKTMIQKALLYPSLVFCSMIVAFLAIIWFVIPPFMVLFEELGTNLPIYTTILIWLYEFFVYFGLYILIFLGIMINAMLFLYKHKDSFRFLCDSLLLRLPLLSSFIILQERYQFCFALSCMLKGAMPLDKAISLATTSVQNKALQRQYNMLLTYIKSTAQPLSQALSTLHLLDSVSIALVRAGEKSAKLAYIFDTITHNLQTQYNQKTDTLLRFLEPALSILMGALIVFLALGVFVPMWDMSANIL